MPHAGEAPIDVQALFLRMAAIINWPVTIDLVVNSPSLSNADKEAILGGTLIKLLRIPAA